MAAERIAQSSNRRGATRRKLNLTVAGETGAGDEAEVALLNLSASGALLRTAQPLRVGERLRLTLPDGKEAAAKVVWQSGELHGCRFERALTPAALSAAVLKSEFSPPADVPAPAETLGQRVKRLRKARRLTMVGLGQRIGVSKPTVWKWETDTVRPRPAAMRDLAAALGVSEIELSYGASATPSAPLGPDGERLREVLAEARELLARITGFTRDNVEVTVALRG